MKLLIVVQRYGEEVAGGAETHAREWALRLVAAGHEVHVATSCALDYVTWRNELASGRFDDHGVTVHRFAVKHERTARFYELDRRLKSGAALTLLMQRHWIEHQGPVLPDLEPWLDRHAGQYDVANFMSYLYHPTVVGLPMARQRTATMMTPTAHDEPAFWMPVMEPPLVLADRIAYNTAEERQLITRRIGRDLPGELVGVGTDAAEAQPDVRAFRASYQLGDDPYLLYVGRIDEGKGVPRLQAWFGELKRRRRGPLRLVLIGASSIPLAPHPDVIVAGVVDEATKSAALSGAMALVQPSRNESFSIVAIEAWDAGIPVICDRGSDVLVGHAMRSGGGLPFGDFLEFEATVELLVSDAVLRTRLGAAGQAYVEQGYRWPAVMSRLESCLEAACEAGVKRLSER